MTTAHPVTKSIPVAAQPPLPKPIRVREFSPLFDDAWGQVRFWRTARGQHAFSRFLRARRKSLSRQP